MTRQRWLELGVVAGIMTLLFALLLPAVHRAREEARKSSSKNNLKQIGLALHNYHDTWGCLPPGGVIAEDGTAMHGWLTMLLPYIEQSSFPNWIDYHKPWNSPVNSYEFDTSIPTYLIVGVENGFTTTGFALTHDQGNPNLFHRNSGVTLKRMENGITHTWMLGEVAGDFQPWGYPYNWRTLGTKLCNGPQSYGRPAWRGGHFVFADGKVSFLSNETSPDILRRLADAPPVATKEQTAKPATTFTTGNVRWERIELLSNPEGENYYFVNVLREAGGKNLVLNLYFYENLTEEERDQPKLVVPVPHFLLRIDTTTDIAAALKVTPLAAAATQEQLAANVKTLQALQKQLP